MIPERVMTIGGYARAERFASDPHRLRVVGCCRLWRSTASCGRTGADALSAVAFRRVAWAVRQ
jgi:hypothetical protein